MDEFVAIATGFPTNIFSTAMIIVAMFWILAIIGLVDIDHHFDMHISHDTDAGGFGEIAGFLNRWGLSGIPVTVIFSVLIVFSWTFCYFGSAYLLSWLPGSVLKTIGGLVLIGLCLFVSFPIAAMSLRPMKSAFVGESAISNKQLIGQSCEVRSGEVTADFGQGLVNDGQAGLLIDIRATQPNDIARGDTVAVLSYDETSNTYKVMPEEDFMKL